MDHHWPLEMIIQVGPWVEVGSFVIAESLKPPMSPLASKGSQIVSENLHPHFQGENYDPISALGLLKKHPFSGVNLLLVSGFTIHSSLTSNPSPCALGGGTKGGISCPHLQPTNQRHRESLNWKNRRCKSYSIQIVRYLDIWRTSFNAYYVYYIYIYIEQYLIWCTCSTKLLLNYFCRLAVNCLGCTQKKMTHT